MRRRRRLTTMLHHFLVFSLLLLATAAAENDDDMSFDAKVLQRRFNITASGDDVIRLDRPPTDPRQLQLLLDSPRARYARHIDLGSLPAHFFCINETNSTTTAAAAIGNLVDLFFPSFAAYAAVAAAPALAPQPTGAGLSSASFEYEAAVAAARLIDTAKFRLASLNLSANALAETFLLSAVTTHYVANPLFVVCAQFFGAHLRLLLLSHNRLRHLTRDHFRLFAAGLVNSARGSPLDTLRLDGNALETLRHDTFYDLPRLRLVDLSRNRLRLIHPLTWLGCAPSLALVDLARNHLRTLYEPLNLTASATTAYPRWTHLRLRHNDQLRCDADCGLRWLWTSAAPFRVLETDCGRARPSCEVEDTGALLEVNSERLRETSLFTKIREWSKRWFAWNLLRDINPVTTPAPYLMAPQPDHAHFDADHARDQVDRTASFFTEHAHHRHDHNETAANVTAAPVTKHIFYSWQFDTAVFECEATRSDVLVVWKTQYGYFGVLDDDMTSSLAEQRLRVMRNESALCEQEDDDPESDASFLTNSTSASYQLFHKLNKLTQVRRNVTLTVGSFWAGSQSTSRIYVDAASRRLVVTNVRQALGGPYACIALTDREIAVYEYELRVRNGVSEHFLYTLVVSLGSMIVFTAIGLTICGIYECTIDRTRPETPIYYPTPNMQTPPNFDFNEWMGSHLPTLNIQDTLNQVSTKLRRGMEKASVTVKSFGVTSSAYIYSMYEHSSQRVRDMRGFIPAMPSMPQMPTISMPRYARPTQLALRMRTGMGSMMQQFREFCGSTDLAHTASMATIDSVPPPPLQHQRSSAEGLELAEAAAVEPSTSSGLHYNQLYYHHHHHHPSLVTVTTSPPPSTSGGARFMPRLFRLNFVREGEAVTTVSQQQPSPHLPINRIYKRSHEMTAGIDYEETVQSLLPVLSQEPRSIAGSAAASMPYIVVDAQQLMPPPPSSLPIVTTPNHSSSSSSSSSSSNNSGGGAPHLNSPSSGESPAKAVHPKANAFSIDARPRAPQPPEEDFDDDDDFESVVTTAPPPPPASRPLYVMLEPIEEKE